MDEYINNSSKGINLGKGCLVEKGEDITIAAAGKMVKTALNVREILKEENIEAEVLNLRFIKPIDNELILKSVDKTKKLVLIDEAAKYSSFAFNILSMLPRNVDVLIKTLPDSFIEQGSIEELLKDNKLDAGSIAADIIKWRV